MVPRGVPDGLEADPTQRIVRTFLVVRIVRGSLLLLFLMVAMVGVEARDWPTGVAIGIALAAVVQAGALVVWCRRHARSGDGSRHGTPP